MRDPMHSTFDRRTAIRRPRAGISLLGVLFSLCGIAVVAMIAIPAFFERKSFTLDNVCELLRRDLRSAQNRATLDHTEVRFVFDNDGWRALDTRGHLLQAFGQEHPILRRFSSDGVFEGVSAKDIHIGLNQELVITTRGTTLERGDITFLFRGEQRVIEIERGSGQVVVEGREEALLHHP